MLILSTFFEGRDLFQIPRSFSGGVGTTNSNDRSWQVNYRALVWALVVSSQCKSVVSLSSTGTLHPASRMARLVGINPEIIQATSDHHPPEIDTNKWWELTKNPAKVYSFFEGKEHYNNLHTNHCEVEFRQDPIETYYSRILFLVFQAVSLWGMGVCILYIFIHIYRERGNSQHWICHGRW